MTAGFHWDEHDGVRVLVPSFFAELGLRGGYSTRSRNDGGSLDLDIRGKKDPPAILSNRKAVAVAMGIAPERFVFAEQVHGASVAEVGPAEEGRGTSSHDDAICGTDALVTRSAGTALVGLAADCAIILLADEERRAIAAVHSGRQGAAKNIAGAAVSKLEELGVPPERLFASIGPAIGACHYEVGEEVTAEFERAFAWGREVITIVAGRAHLDLPGAVKRQLIEAGVRSERIFDAGLCTVCENDTFFSYRREGQQAGRFAGVIAIG
jgi:hypothetical protein